MMTYTNAPITGKRKLTQGIFEYTLHCPELAAQAVPGQFVHIKVPGFSLRRPISICRIPQGGETLVLVLEARGAGTAALAKLERGDELDLIGPVGKGFALPPEAKSAVLVGGGIGSPPLLELAARYGGKAHAFLGFRNADAIILLDEFASLGCAVQLATDDGSRGHHGLVTFLLEKHLGHTRPDIIYTCGPKPMLAAVARLAAAYNIRCQVSLEEHMACGVGACLGCACLAAPTDAQGGDVYQHVCKDGPVFEANQVVLEP